MLPSYQGSRRRPKLVFFVAGILLVLLFSRSIAGLILDYHWWAEVGQLDTWRRSWIYDLGPGLVQWLILFALLWVSHARGMKYAGTGLSEHPLYAKLATLAAAFLAFILIGTAVDGSTAAQYFYGREVASAWVDPVFGKSLTFYFFELPFLREATGFLAACAVVSALAFYLTARVWQLRLRFPEIFAAGQLQLTDLKVLGSLEAGMFRVAVAIFLVLLAVRFWLGRYLLLYSDHGELMTGIDYVAQNYGLPLQFLKMAGALAAAVLVLLNRRKLALACALVLVVDAVVPPLVSSLIVRPNELALERPYLERHIEATRSAYGLSERTQEVEFAARKEAPINLTRNAQMLDNVRLWDWQAFHDTLSQSQPLRPYAYADTDIDRYQIEGSLRQTMLAPRELDLNQLGQAQSRWVIANTIYTHGYGLALAEASRITPAGLPELIIRDAPPEISVPGLQLMRPEIYYGESSRSPVFVRTTQPEFDYPSGSQDVNTRYEGQGGFPIGSIGLRGIAAWALGDWNIVLSDALTSESRMMMKRSVSERLRTLAPFVMWDGDPYLVIDDVGRLHWIVDGYTFTDRHPYARDLFGSNEHFNYIRNSVRATVDAYEGVTKFYVFDEADPLIQVYRKMFPTLLVPASEMPADLRRHTRAPEFLFRAKAEIYRTYHMRNPESFYNRADLWDLATFTGGQTDMPSAVSPNYIVMTLPGEERPEFVLTIPFTPRDKQNLIGLMVARCDGEHLGEVVFLQLPKQEIIPGPLQIEALINQDDVISKDLSLWNQQGSQVLRGQVQVLPIDNTFLFVMPLYIQASQARMPQLEKIVLATGNQLIYADNYRDGLAELARRQGGEPVFSAAPSQPAVPAGTNPAPAAEAAQPGNAVDPRIGTIRDRLQRYKALSAQGKWAEAGRELEAIEALVGR